MKIPLKWLADYLSIELPVAELVQRLTLAGLEVSGVRVIGPPIPPGVRVKPEDQGPVWDRDKIFVAQIVQIEPTMSGRGPGPLNAITNAVAPIAR